MLLSFFISISNYFIGPYFSSSFTAWLKFLKHPRKTMKQQTGDNHIHQSILPPKNIFFMNIPTYKTMDKITIINARFLFALFDIENRFYSANLVIFIDWLTIAIPSPHTNEYSSMRVNSTSTEGCIRWRNHKDSPLSDWLLYPLIGWK